MTRPWPLSAPVDVGADAVVVNERNSVLGRARTASLAAADPDEAVDTIMSVG